MNLQELGFHKTAALSEEALSKLTDIRLNRLREAYMHGQLNIENAFAPSKHYNPIHERLGKFTESHLDSLRTKVLDAKQNLYGERAKRRDAQDAIKRLLGGK